MKCIQFSHLGCSRQIKIIPFTLSFLKHWIYSMHKIWFFFEALDNMHQLRLFWVPLVTFNGKKYVCTLLFIFTAVVDSFSLLILTYFIFSQAALCIKVNLVNNKMNEVQKRIFELTFSFYGISFFWSNKEILLSGYGTRVTHFKHISSLQTLTKNYSPISKGPLSEG